jgi:starch-binding outer membrane protein, SusD/RagB family
MKPTKLLPIIAVCIYLASCKKFVVADSPIDSISSATAFANDGGAIATLTSIYINLKNDGNGLAAGNHSIGFYTAMEGDELKNYSSGDDFPKFYTNSLTKDAASVYSIWTQIYGQIHTANIVLENLEKSTTITASVKQQMLGEAKFIRAFLHFYAVNLFGKVPLVLTSDYRINNTISRSDTNVVYQQIVADLKDAQNTLSDKIVDGYGAIVTTRYRPNKWTATALLARVYLYQKDWMNAEMEAAKLKTNDTYELDNNLINIFTGESKEVIWQMQAVISYRGAFDGEAYILTTEPELCTMSLQLLGAFELGDTRFSNWVGKFNSDGIDYHYPFKYKVSSLVDPSYLENTTVFRLAEQYLISAEAKIQQGKIAEGVADLNILRQRARLAPTVAVPDPLPDLLTTLSKEDALKAVMHERQVELFTEWGHRWFDLKRTGEINSVMTAVAPSKNTEWHPYQAWWPVPNSEILLNANLDQNEGYN